MCSHHGSHDGDTAVTRTNAENDIEDDTVRYKAAVR